MCCRHTAVSTQYLFPMWAENCIERILDNTSVSETHYSELIFLFCFKRALREVRSEGAIFRGFDHVPAHVSWIANPVLLQGYWTRASLLLFNHRRINLKRGVTARSEAWPVGPLQGTSWATSPGSRQCRWGLNGPGSGQPLKWVSCNQR
jgi:hypothetical protein